MTAPDQLDPARIDAIVDDLLATLGGRQDARAVAGALCDAFAISGAWTLDDDGLWLTAAAGGAVLLLPFATEHSTIYGLGALVYCASTAAAAQPAAAAVVSDDAGTVVATGSSTTAPARLGWAALAWSGAGYATSGRPAFLRVTAGAAGDRLALGFLSLGSPP
jgi:hypothetical protein